MLDPILSDILENVDDGVYYVDTNRRITYWNRSAQRISGFATEQVTGRCCADNILCHVDNKGVSLCKSMCPLAHSLVDGQPREAEVNLHHRDGYRVPVHVAVRVIRDAEGKIVGAVETFRECSDVISMRSSIQHLKQWGCVDIPTGLASRRVVEARAAERMQELQRFGWPFGILLIEVDLLPEITQQFGAEGAAEAVRMAARCAQYSLRSLDMVGRWNDTAFVAVIANASEGDIAAIAERVRMMVDHAFRETPDGQLHVTVSIGAVAATERENMQALLARAQRCVFESRSHGRNRVTVARLPRPEKE